MLFRRAAAFLYDSLLVLAVFFVVTGAVVYLNDSEPVGGLGFVALLRWGVGLSLGASMTWLIVVAGLGFVYVFRVSRSIWLAMNATYDQTLSDRLARADG